MYSIDTIYSCDCRRGIDLVNGFNDHLYTPLETTLYRSLTHADYCPQSITDFSGRFLATAST
jgi:hypothetical protein